MSKKKKSPPRPQTLTIINPAVHGQPIGAAAGEWPAIVNHTDIRHTAKK